MQLKMKQKTTCRPLWKRLDADQEITYNETHVFYTQADVYCGKQHNHSSSAFPRSLFSLQCITVAVKFQMCKFDSVTVMEFILIN